MGCDISIIDLPYLHMYWEEGWSQSYVVEAFSRDRFKELLRYFHIAEPTPRGVKRTVDEKIKPLFDHCLTIFPEYFTPPEILTLNSPSWAKVLVVVFHPRLSLFSVAHSSLHLNKCAARHR